MLNLFAQFESWDDFVKFVGDKGADLGVNLLAAIAILIIGRIVAGILRSIAERMMLKAKVDQTLARFLSHIAYAALITFVIIAAIDRLGVDTTSFAAILAAAGLAVGLALQGSLSNFAAGVMLILFKPFKVGNFVEAGGAKGTIEDIHIFNTLIRTGDNVLITVPNSQITGGKITNFSAKETRRIDLVIGCSYDDDLKAVKAYLQSALESDERILAEPAPVVAVDELGDSSVNFVVRPWVNAGDYATVKWDLIEKIKVDFDERGFNLPYPQRDVHVHGMTA